jgi:hypothetical protein
MQKVAAYLLERREGMESSEHREVEAKHLQEEILKWLSTKGASPAGGTGTFKPEDGSTGSFSIEEAAAGDRTWWMLQLDEVSPQGQHFKTALSITSSSDRVSVYVTLEVGWTTASIIPISVDARCPRIVRSIVGLPGHWYHGSSTFRPLQIVKGFEEGEALAAEIVRSDRSVPVIVVSSTEHGSILSELDTKLAYDLAGLVNVVSIDEDASWALTDVLSAGLSCYRGAVRLYWPHLTENNERRFHPLWTAERLLSSGHDTFATRERFRKQ